MGLKSLRSPFHCLAVGAAGDLVMGFILERSLQLLHVETAQGRGPHLHLLDKRNECEIRGVRLDVGDGCLGREHYMKRL